MHETGPEKDVRRLKARLERERSARLEAETIAERALRELYDKREALAREATTRQELELQIREGQKMEAIGRLAGGVAHDFNNLLTIILGMSESILGVVSPDHEARPSAVEIHKAGERGATLTRQLIALSRRQVLAPSVLNLNAIVEDLERMVTYLVGMDIEVEITLDPALRSVKADSTQLEQAVINLVVNARDAMPHGGKLVVETKNVDLDSAEPQQHPDMRPGRYVMLAVSDTGAGLDAEAQRRLFEPFFTSDELGRDTGLGLAVVYGIVKQSHGHVLVDSEPDRGTTLRIYFPEAVESQRTAASHDLSTAEARGGSETVLIVEDEPALLMLASAILKSQGYTVVQALDGNKAFAAAREHAGPIHLILADVVLPGLKGPEVAKRIQALRPGIKVAFMSGYTDTALERHHGFPSGAPFLQKPFTPERLIKYVRYVLDVGSEQDPQPPSHLPATPTA
jgi:signal transduction histidine kinase